MTTQAQRETMESLYASDPVVLKIAASVSNETKGGTSGSFVLYSTTAPARYDYAGRVIPVLENDGIRWVLIDERGLTDQLNRYASGLYAYYRSIDPTPGGLLAALWTRILGQAD